MPLGDVAEQFVSVRPLPLIAALLLAFLVRLVSALQFKYLTDVQDMRVSLGRIYYIL